MVRPRPGRSSAKGQDKYDLPASHGLLRVVVDALDIRWHAKGSERVKGWTWPSVLSEAINALTFTALPGPWGSRCLSLGHEAGQGGNATGNRRPRRVIGIGNSPSLHGILEAAKEERQRDKLGGTSIGRIPTLFLLGSPGYHRRLTFP